MKGENFFRDWSCFFMDLTIQEKGKLIEFFQFLLNKEIDKPLGEMNSEAVDNYIKILLHLQDNHIELSSEFINEQVRKIFRKEDTITVIPDTVKTKKNYFNKKKVWLVAACIAILVALFSIISVANDWNVFDFLTEKFGSVHSSPVEEEVDFNGVTITNHGKRTKYKTIEDAMKGENLDVLYPTLLPDDTSIDNIIIYEENNEKKLIFIFDNVNLNSEIYMDKSLEQSTKDEATEIITIDDLECYVCEMSDISLTQISFEYKGNKYLFSYTDKVKLIELVENLEEIKNEN